MHSKLFCRRFEYQEIKKKGIMEKFKTIEGEYKFSKISIKKETESHIYIDDSPIKKIGESYIYHDTEEEAREFISFDLSEEIYKNKKALEELEHQLLVVEFGNFNFNYKSMIVNGWIETLAFFNGEKVASIKGRSIKKNIKDITALLKDYPEYD